MSIKIGHACNDENRRSKGGTAGDQTKREVCVRDWYSSPWDTILRCKNSSKAEKMAKACEAGCANDYIGYDQNQRNTLNAQAKAVGYDLSKIKTPCECDCSSFMTVCAQAAGINIPYTSGNAPFTGNMKLRFTSTGMFDVLTDKKYTNSDEYVKRGDILLKSTGHTAMALENGSKVKTTSATTKGGVCNVTLTQLSKGCKGAQVKALQLLLIGYGYNCGASKADGSFGNNTYKAVVKFQKAYKLTADGIVGINTWTKLLKG